MSSIISLATPDLSFLQLRIARPTPCNLVNMRHGTKDVDLLLVCHTITCILDICTDVRENDGYIRPPLRIDNSRRGRIHSLWHISRTTKATTSCDISNERTYFSACVDISSF